MNTYFAPEISISTEFIGQIKRNGDLSKIVYTTDHLLFWKPVIVHVQVAGITKICQVRMEVDDGVHGRVTISPKESVMFRSLFETEKLETIRYKEKKVKGKPLSVEAGETLYESLSHGPDDKVPFSLNPVWVKGKGRVVGNLIISVLDEKKNVLASKTFNFLVQSPNYASGSHLVHHSPTFEGDD